MKHLPNDKPNLPSIDVDVLAEQMLLDIDKKAIDMVVSQLQVHKQYTAHTYD